MNLASAGSNALHYVAKFNLILKIYSLQTSFCGGRLVAHNLMILLH